MTDSVKKILNYIFRFIFGGVFIFSGFVKAVDPMGTAFKTEEYMNVFGFDGLLSLLPSLPLILAVILCCAEFMIGVSVLLHIYNKVNKWVAAVFMLFFTVVTLIDALTNNVSDCGCFGDAVKLSNWQTFIKNIILDVLLVGIFITDNKLPQQFKKPSNYITLAVFAVLITVFSIRNILYEPCIDFRPWKTGNKMAPTPSEQGPVVSYALYKNNSTQEQREFSMDELMKEYQSDTNFQMHWTFVQSRFINPNTVNADGFSMTAFGSDNDESLEILSDTTHDTYMIVVVDLNQASPKGMQRISKFAKKQNEAGSKVVLLTASSPDTWIEFMEKYNLTDYMMYSSDDKALKAMARTNPAVVHIKNTVVADKYSWRNLPK